MIVIKNECNQATGENDFTVFEASKYLGVPREKRVTGNKQRDPPSNPKLRPKWLIFKLCLFT